MQDGTLSWMSNHMNHTWLTTCKFKIKSNFSITCHLQIKTDAFSWGDVPTTSRMCSWGSILQAMANWNTKMWLLKQDIMALQDKSLSLWSLREWHNWLRRDFKERKLKGLGQIDMLKFSTATIQLWSITSKSRELLSDSITSRWRTSTIL